MKMALVKIVYASMTGNTEEISEILEEQFQEAGVEVEREECSEVDVDFFDDADACIIATYTRILMVMGNCLLNLKISLMN